MAYSVRDRIAGYCIHQANVERTVRRDFLGRNQQLERSSLPDEPRETLGSSPTCDQAQSGAAMAKYRAGSGKSTMTGEGQIESSSHAMAVDRSNYKSRITGDGVHERLAFRGESVGFRAGERGDFVEIGSNGEIVLSANDERLCGGMRMRIEGS